MLYYARAAAAALSTSIRLHTSSISGTSGSSQISTIHRHRPATSNINAFLCACMSACSRDSFDRTQLNQKPVGPDTITVPGSCMYQHQRHHRHQRRASHTTQCSLMEPASASQKAGRVPCAHTERPLLITIAARRAQSNAYRTVASTTSPASALFSQLPTVIEGACSFGFRVVWWFSIDRRSIGFRSTVQRFSIVRWKSNRVVVRAVCSLPVFAGWYQLLSAAPVRDNIRSARYHERHRCACCCVSELVCATGVSAASISIFVHAFPTCSRRLNAKRSHIDRSVHAYVIKWFVIGVWRKTVPL